MRIFSSILSSFAALLVAAPLVSCTSLGAGSSEVTCTDGHCGEEPPPPDANPGCTLTQGYWKNHAEAWPVASLLLGNHSYEKAKLLEILRTPVKGNGLVSLAHQLIAVKLNVAAGADDLVIATAVLEADAKIGNLVLLVDKLPTHETAELVAELDAFNNGATGPGHCDDAPDAPDVPDDGGDCETGCEPSAVCGNGSVEDGEACDDGNVTNGDGCSAVCTVEEHVCVCGDGIVDEAHEQCDDGNTTAGDGCSATCTVEVPVCGNGVVETGEQCDDGNTTDHDGCSPTCVIETNECNPC